MDICHYISVQTRRMYNTKRCPKVNCGLWMTIMCQCRFILSMKHSILVSDVEYGGGFTCVGVAAYEKPLSPSQCYCNPKIALKKISRFV